MKFDNKIESNFFLQTSQKSILFEIAVSEVKIDKFQPEIIGDVRVDDKMGAEYFKQFVQMQDMLQEDMDQYLSKQITKIKSDVGLQQILK
jgi:hypothetical protein